MTPPFRIFSADPPHLSCELCREPELSPSSPTALPDSQSQVGLPLAEDSFSLNVREFLSPLPFRPPALFSPALSNPLGLNPQTTRRLSRLQFQDFLPALIQAANRIERMDVDFHHIPVNRGSGLCRFSESTPRTARPEACTVVIQPGTLARAHGEIRPVRGSSQSLITRVLVDFRPNVLNLIPGLPPLEIDGFAAIDPPRMRFDRTFSHRERSVLEMRGGNYDYENPQANGEVLASPFESTAAPPPGGHRYWMFRFNPIADDLISGLEEWTANGDNPFTRSGLGGLLLWANLPSVGLGDPARFAALDIPFNTFPRRAGDLIELLRPLFDPDTAARLRQTAPLLNPNTEYLDPEGVRRGIPEDPREIDAINRRLRAEGLPPIGRNRGAILDFAFHELARDPRRLAALDSDELPYATARVRMHGVTLELPMGRMEIREGTELRIHFALERVRDSETGEVRARRSLRLSFEPLQLGEVDWNLQDYRLRADSMSVRRAVLYFPSIDHLNDEEEPALPRWSLVLQGVRAEGLELQDEAASFQIQAALAQLGRFRIDRYPASLRSDLGSFQARALRVRHELGELRVDRARVPSLTIRLATPQPGIQRSSVRMNRLESEGSLSLAWERDGSPTHLQLRATAELGDLNFHQETDANLSRTRLGFDIAASIESAEVQHEQLGRVSFTTNPSDGRCALGEGCEIRGTFRSSTDRPRGSREPNPSPHFDLALNLPFVGFWTGGSFVEIARGSSTLERGTLHLSPENVSLEGDLNLHASLPRGLGEGPTAIGNLILTPRIPELDVRGPARLEIFHGGWRLRRPTEAGDGRLNLSLRLADSELNHHPRALPPYLARLPQAAIIHTDLNRLHAQVQVEDLREVEYRQIESDGEPRGGFTRLESGPITAHHLSGSGSIWVELLIWGFVRGFFPQLGGGSALRRVDRPTVEPILRHLPTEVRERIGDGDFFRIGGVRFRRYSDGWESAFEDVLLNVHEEGGRGQFGMSRIPEVILGERERHLEWYLSPDFLLNIFLQEPERGGDFRFVRWTPLP